MAQEDIQLMNLRDQLDALAKKYREAKSITALDEDGGTVAPPMTKEEIDAAAAAYGAASKQMGLSCQQLVLGIRITS